jgi:hypothetical protein
MVLPLVLHKVACQRRVVAIVNMPFPDDVDRTIMGRLPLREFLELEAVWPVRHSRIFLRIAARIFGAEEVNV